MSQMCSVMTDVIVESLYERCDVMSQLSSVMTDVIVESLHYGYYGICQLDVIVKKLNDGHNITSHFATFMTNMMYTSWTRHNTADIFHDRYGVIINYNLCGSCDQI